MHLYHFFPPEGKGGERTREPAFFFIWPKKERERKKSFIISWRGKGECAPDLGLVRIPPRLNVQKRRNRMTSPFFSSEDREKKKERGEPGGRELSFSIHGGERKRLLSSSGSGEIGRKVLFPNL